MKNKRKSDPLRDRPTLVPPDDHDVFQGNIWGEGGAKMKDQSKGSSSKGGYREPARMVNAVHKTCVAHHPDFYDPTPSKQEVSVYFGDMVYGDVSFAIIADRQWKSGPERVDSGSGRADHVKDLNRLRLEALEATATKAHDILASSIELPAGF